MSLQNKGRQNLVVFLILGGILILPPHALLCLQITTTGGGSDKIQNSTIWGLGGTYCLRGLNQLFEKSFPMESGQMGRASAYGVKKNFKNFDYLCCPYC